MCTEILCISSGRSCGLTTRILQRRIFETGRGDTCHDSKAQGCTNRDISQAPNPQAHRAIASTGLYPCPEGRVGGEPCRLDARGLAGHTVECDSYDECGAGVDFKGIAENGMRGVYLV